MLMAGSSTPYYIYKDSSLMIIDSLTKDISLVSADDCLIIPDVHGRDFWKDAANRFPGNIVFLGDYLDPYPLEGISPDEAFTNFQEILSFKKANPDRVTLLLGNHDLQYFSKAYSLYSKSNRYSWKYAQLYEDTFHENSQLFQLAHTLAFPESEVLFTHAGVHSCWLHQHPYLLPEVSAEAINRLLDTEEGIVALTECSKIRGGDYPAGSPVWGDQREMIHSEPIEGTYQIFGHTMLEVPVITCTFACLDTQNVYAIDPHLKINIIK